MAINYPMGILSKNWKLTIPLKSAPEIVQPKLASYTSEWFHLNESRDGVVFLARTDGGTTPNSKNPRSELREMRDDGADEAEWNSGIGQHSMLVDLMVTALPIGSKPHVVVAQIHDSSDDMTVFRLEGKSLWITDDDKTHGYLVTDNYVLGTRILVGFHVSDGVVGYSLDGKLIPYTQNKKRSGCYFKTGAYNQAGGIVTKLPDGKADYAEVVLYSVQVCHDGVCEGNAPGAPPIDPPPDTGDLADALRRLGAVEQRAGAVEQDVARLRAALAALGK